MGLPDLSMSLPRVLVVDDEPLTRRALGRLIPRDEFHVSFADDGESALAAMMTKGFDVVITDVQMPGLNGLEMLRHVRDLDERLPVIFVTGRPSVRMAAQAVELGAFRYLVKPVRPKVFCEALRSAVKRRAETKSHTRPVAVVSASVAPLATSQQSLHQWFDTFVELGPRCRRMAIASIGGATVPFVRLTLETLYEYCSAAPAWLSQAVIEVPVSDPIFGNTHLRSYWDALRGQQVALAIADHNGDVGNLAELGSLKPNYVVLADALLAGLDTAEAQQDSIVRITEVCRLVGARMVAPCFDDVTVLGPLQMLGCELYQSCVITRSCAPGELAAARA